MPARKHQHTPSQMIVPKGISQLLDHFDIEQDLSFMERSPGLCFPLRTKREGAGSLCAYHEIETLQRAYPDIERLLDALDRATSKFDFKRTSLQEWRDYYLFPASPSVPVPRWAPALADDPAFGAPSATDELDVINSSPTVASQWLATLLRHVRAGGSDAGKSKRLLAFVLGKVGSGKSSFIKYLLNIHVSAFREARVIATRIECSKLDRDRRDNQPYKDALFECITRSLVRDVFRIMKGDNPTLRRDPSDDNIDNIIGGDSLREFLIDYMYTIAARKGTPSLGLDTIRTKTLREEWVAHELRLLHRYRDDPSPQRLRDINRTTCELLLYYVFSRGYRFIPMLDGFDYITAADRLMDARNCHWLSAAADALLNWDKERVLADYKQQLPMHFVIVIRENTLPDFMRHVPRVNPAKSKIRFYNVKSPTSDQLLRSAIWRVFTDTGAGHSAASRALRSYKAARPAVVKALDVPPSMSIDDIFNGNARFMIRFLRYTLLLLLDHITARRGRPAVADEAKALEDILAFDLSDYAKYSGYRFFEVLLLTNHRWFTNHMEIDKDYFDRLLEFDPDPEQHEGVERQLEEMTRRAFKECDEEAGYCDNVYNYHTYDRDPGGKAFLEKLWILRLLMRNGGNSMQAAQIREELGAVYGYNPPHLDWTLSLMVKNGQISISPQAGREAFYAEGHGRYAATVLWKKLAYVEHVFHETLYPEPVARAGIDCVRFDDRERWKLAAIVNSYLHLQYFCHVEKSMTGPSNGRAAQEKRLREQLRASVRGSVERMCKREITFGAENEARSSLAEEALATICTIVDKWDERSGAGVGCE